MTRRRRVRCAGALTWVAALVLSACGGGEGSSGQLGETLPDVEIESFDGETSSLSAIGGPAVINLWATWCAPCRAEIPDFEEVHQRRGDAVRFVGINIGEDSSTASAFLDEVGATYDQFLDPEGYVVTELGTTATPITLVLDGTGEVTARHLGPMDVDDLDAAIDEALAES